MFSQLPTLLYLQDRRDDSDQKHDEGQADRDWLPVGNERVRKRRKTQQGGDCGERPKIDFWLEGRGCVDAKPGCSSVTVSLELRLDATVVACDTARRLSPDP